MKWLNNRFLLLSYFVLLTVLVTVGCTSKEDPSEVLPLCGNHSCGNLRMVTTDTSSDGFHYLNPTMSPNGENILFTADWKAIPSFDHYDEDAFYTNHRQLIIMPGTTPGDTSGIPPFQGPLGDYPAHNLKDQGGILVRLNGFFTSVRISGNSVNLDDAENDRKGGPVWWNDDNIIFWMKTPRGNRLFTTDVSGMIAQPNEVVRAAGNVLYMEPEDATVSGGQWQHMEPNLSPNGEWLAFTRSGCAIPDSFEECTGASLRLLRMSTAGQNNGYAAQVITLTDDFSRLEKPRWHPDGDKIVFSGGLDLDGGTGAGTEIYTIDVDTDALNNGEVVLNNNITRLTYTSYSSGDPIVGVFNTSPCFTQPGGNEIYFVSTRRAPSITLHDRNLWWIPADGSLDPQILYFTRADDLDPEVLSDGRVLLSSLLGFPTEMLDTLENEAYLDLVAADEGLTEVEMRSIAYEQRRQLEFFEGVMAQIYIFRP